MWTHTITITLTPSHHHSLSLSHCHTITLPLSHYHTITLSHHHTTTHYHYHTVIPSHYRYHTITPSHYHYHTVTPSHYQAIVYCHNTHCCTMTSHDPPNVEPAAYKFSLQVESYKSTRRLWGPLFLPRAHKNGDYSKSV